MNEASDLRRSAARSFLWAIVQTWGSRAISMLFFFGLARLLSPADFGLASSAILVFSLAALVSELGIGDALLRDRTLRSSDFDTPFLVSLTASLLIAGLVAASAHRIAFLLDVPRLSPFVVCAAALVPLSVVASFQEAMMKREMQFQKLALRALVSGLVGGSVGIAMASAGQGAWALLGQFAVQVLVGTIWLWIRPAWRPGLELNLNALRSIGAFGLNLIGMRVVDFTAMRAVDFLVLAHLGPAAFGLFAVSTRLYQFLMQLFQASVNSVGLATLSRVAHDRERLARVFIRTFSLSAMVGSPPFFLLAALAPEVGALAFGARWEGADRIMAPFLVVGGIHCIQFGAGSYLAALGRSDTLLRLMILKAALVLLPLLLIRPETASGMADLIAAGLLMEAPFIVGATLRNLQLSWTSLIRPVAVPLVASLVAAACTFQLTHSVLVDQGDILRFVVGSASFLLIYALSIAVSSASIAITNIHYVMSAFRK